MNDFWFFIGSLTFVSLLAAFWCVMKELFTRWLNNDWCKHDWGGWEAVSALGVGTYGQTRFCKKCNKAERRIL